MRPRAPTYRPESLWRATATAASGRAEFAQLGDYVGAVPQLRRLPELHKDGQQPLALVIAQLVGARLIALDGFADDVTARATEAGREPTESPDRLVVERECDFYH